MFPSGPVANLFDGDASYAVMHGQRGRAKRALFDEPNVMLRKLGKVLCFSAPTNKAMRVGMDYVFGWSDVLQIVCAIILAVVVNVVDLQPGIAFAKKSICNQARNLESVLFPILAKACTQSSALPFMKLQDASGCGGLSWFRSPHATKARYFITAIKANYAAPLFYAHADSIPHAA